MDIPETNGDIEPYTFTSKLTGKEIFSLEQSLRLIKVDEGKCEDDIRLSFLLVAFCFTMKVVGATFTTNAIVLRVKSVP